MKCDEMGLNGCLQMWHGQTYGGMVRHIQKQIQSNAFMAVYSLLSALLNSFISSTADSTGEQRTDAIAEAITYIFTGFGRIWWCNITYSYKTMTTSMFYNTHFTIEQEIKGILNDSDSGKFLMISILQLLSDFTSQSEIFKCRVGKSLKQTYRQQ